MYFLGAHRRPCWRPWCRPSRWRGNDGRDHTRDTRNNDAGAGVRAGAKSAAGGRDQHLADHSGTLIRLCTTCPEAEVNQTLDELQSLGVRDVRIAVPWYVQPYDPRRTTGETGHHCHRSGRRAT